MGPNLRRGGIRIFPFLLLAGGMVASCTSADGDPDAGRDAVDPVDTGSDGGGELQADVRVDVRVDLPAEVPVEVLVEVPVEVPADNGPDMQPCTSDCGEMVPVAAGPFRMGCVDGAAGADCDSTEKPAHEVDVPAFEIDVTETPMGLYARCVQAGGCTVPNSSSPLCTYGRSGMELHPVNCVDHLQAEAFCRWAGRRLCSEAEWEKAAVGTDGRKYPWGEAPPTCDLAVLDEGGFGCGSVETAPVGSRPAGASPYGALDMAGNVWEWVEDHFHDSYVGAPADGSAWMVPATPFQVGRGGALSDKAPVLRSSARRKFSLQLDGYYLGIRCCLSSGQ